MFDRGRALVAQVLEQDIAQLAGGAAAKGVQDRLVLAHRFAPAIALASEIGGVAHPADPSCEVGVGAAQRCIAGGFDDLLMDQLVVAGDWSLKLWEIHRREINPNTILEIKIQISKPYPVFNSCCNKEIYKRSKSNVQVIPIRVSLELYISLII